MCRNPGKTWAMSLSPCATRQLAERCNNVWLWLVLRASLTETQSPAVVLVVRATGPRWQGSWWQQVWRVVWSVCWFSHLRGRWSTTTGVTTWSVCWFSALTTALLIVVAFYLVSLRIVRTTIAQLTSLQVCFVGVWQLGAVMKEIESWSYAVELALIYTVSHESIKVPYLFAKCKLLNK